LSFGSFGNGTTSHLAGEMFKVMAGVDIVHVPYKGSAPAMTDLIGGQIPLTFDTNVAAMPAIASGKVKALGIASKARSPQMPDIATIAESGYPDFEMVPWVVIVAPKGLPVEVQKKLSSALETAVNDPVVRAELQKVGLDVNFEPGQSYATRVAKELPLLRMYVEQAKIPSE
jgi:tripartite-type tricarboxylate transporter receptor subunit TctC